MNDQFFEAILKEAPSEWEEQTIMGDMRRDLSSFLKMVKFYEPVGYAKVNMNESPTGGLRILLMHDYGPYWSKFLEAKIRGGYRYMTGKMLPEDATTFLNNGLSVNIE